MLDAMTSRPPLAQSLATVTAGTAPFFAHVAVDRAVTVESLEPARIMVWLLPLMLTKARPSGTFVETSALTWAVPSAVPAGTSTKISSPSPALVTALPSLSTTPMPAGAPGTTDRAALAPGLVPTLIGPRRSPALPETAAGERLREALGSSTFVALLKRYSVTLAACLLTGVASTLSE